MNKIASNSIFAESARFSLSGSHSYITIHFKESDTIYITKTSEKWTISLQGKNGLAQMCPWFRGFTVFDCGC